MIQEGQQILDVAGSDSITVWAMRIGVVALFTYVWRNERYQHTQDLAIQKLQSDSTDHDRQLDHVGSDLKELVKMVTHIDRVVRRMAVSQNIHVREDE